MRRNLTCAVTASAFSFCLALAGAASIAATPASAHGFRVIYTFCKDGGDCLEGAGPEGLVEDANGNFYGVAYSGGASKYYGVAYELERTAKSQYKYKVLYNFGATIDDAAGHVGSLVLDTAGDLFGAAGGGTHEGGAIFELVPDKRHRNWMEQILYNFCSQENCTDGGGPDHGLTYAGAASGALYDGKSPLFGVTFGTGGEGGGAPSVAYELQPGAGFQLLHTFGSGGDGAGAIGPLAEDASGNLYGETIQGGAYTNAGVVYELSPAKNGYAETVLHTFCPGYPCADGATPESGVVMDTSGNLYGTTYYGGADCPVDGDVGCGVAYMVKPDGINSQETVLHTFCSSKHCADGLNPVDPLFLDAQGNLFGTTLLGGNKVAPDGQGTLFEISGSNFQVLHKFCQQPNCTDGANPDGAPIRDPKGRLFGTAGGGAGHGIAYELVP
ncbi:MAG TPA: choice-of-anchor tandem repeat GloVer-containing protein [Rhizomicrobium sp.]|jgi:uncharacterized repeat protein (TIGR03803 family)